MNKGNGDVYKTIPFEVNYSKHIIIKQSTSGGKFYYEIFVDDERIWRIENKNARGVIF